eukprot:CAMPEP_0204160038 /NCGR_PEP_ID=MMETSP0361-20130328/33522_1 /ASSEMBLY_ACC=CAM_ASM_000343 /TAXON_ID=268821 /ORGANISM="Scrippsiella Hangoei, Strain SHTV-5" /LENGTH=34 /DNA_ID= /DNA_START= /DNA_END= /DNA_ORIENTATION=
MKLQPYCAEVPHELGHGRHTIQGRPMSQVQAHNS